MAMHPIAQQLHRVQRELSSTYFERSAAVEALILALLAGVNAYILGPPGTAKTEMSEDLLHRFVGARVFSQQLSRNLPAEVVLGPVKMRLLREEDRYERETEGYLPDCDLAFIDEVGKGSNTLGHNMLSIFNEHIFRERRVDPDTGQVVHRHPVPLLSAITTSNEDLREQGEQGAALYDRLLVKVRVDYIGDTTNFAAFMAAGRPTSTPTLIDYAEFLQAVALVKEIEIPEHVVEALTGLKVHLRDELSIVLSDRRWGKSRDILRAAAFLAGRDAVDLDDLGALQYTLWEKPNDIPMVARAVTSVANPALEAVLKLVDDIGLQREEVQRYRGRSDADKAGAATTIFGKATMIKRELEQARDRFVKERRATGKVDDALDQVAALEKLADDVLLARASDV